MHFSTKSIAEFNGLSLSQKQQMLRIAMEKMSAVQKITLAVIKLILLSAAFLLIANVHSWWLLVYLLLVGISYPVVTTPITLLFCKPYYQAARAEIDAKHTQGD